MERKLFSMLIAGFAVTAMTGAANGVVNDPLPLMPKSEYPGTGNEPAGITGIAADASSPSGSAEGAASRVTVGAVAIEPLPLMPKSEYPGTGNEPAGITGVSPATAVSARSESGQEVGQASGVSPVGRTETEEAGRDFGEEAS